MGGNFNPKLTKKFQKKLKIYNDKNSAPKKRPSLKPGAQEGWVHQKELVLFRNIVNGMFLGIRRLDPRKVVLGELGDSGSEFIFFMESKDDSNDQRISYDNAVLIKSIIGGTLSLALNEKLDHYISFGNEDANQENSNIETSNDELEIESKLDDLFGKGQGKINTKIIKNDFSTTKDSLTYFFLEQTSSFDTDEARMVNQFLSGIISFYKFLQSWGVRSGKQLINSLGADVDERGKYNEEGSYYHYDTGCETQNDLAEKSKSFQRIINEF